MTIKTLASRGATNRHIARLLGVTEGTVRHHVGGLEEGAAAGDGAGARLRTAPSEFSFDSYSLVVCRWQGLLSSGRSRSLLWGRHVVS